MTDTLGILNTIDNYDKFEIHNNFPNIKYVGLTSKNTVLHLIAMLTGEFKRFLPLLNRILKNKLVNINAVNSQNETCLHLGLKYCNYEFTKYILENSNPNLYIKESTNKTIFEYACVRGNLDVIILLLEKETPYTSKDIAFISDDNIRNRVYEILFNDKSIPYEEPNIENLPEDSFFKIYGEQDFIYDQTQPLGAGSFGLTFLVVDKYTGKKCVIKKFIGNKGPIYSDQEIKDIVFLRSLKKRRHTVQIYGVFIDSKSDVYMVMEYLHMTLHERLKIIKEIKNKEDRIKQFKNILYEIILCVDGNSNAGIIHCDTKSNNMMINSSGIVKYIDYGWSYYLGISPIISNINHSIHTASYLIKDGARENTIFYFYENDINIFSIESGYLGLNLDVASISMIFIKDFFSGMGLLCSHKGKFYKNVKRVNKQDIPSITDPNINDIFTLEEDTTFTEKLIELYGLEITNFLILMLEIDNNIRPMAKELLNDKFFGRNSIKYPKDLVLTNLNNTGLRPMFDLYNTVTQKNYLRHGFVYFDNIINHYSEDTAIFIKTNNINYDATMQFLKRYINIISPDALCSTIFYINDCIDRANRGLDSPFNINDLDSDMIIPLVIIVSYSVIYEDPPDMNIKYIMRELAKNPKFDRKTTEKKIIEITDKLRRDPGFYKIKPIMLYIGYIKFILQVVCIDENKIKTIILDLIKKVIERVFDHPKTSSNRESIEELNIFNTVKYHYNQIPDKIDLF